MNTLRPRHEPRPPSSADMGASTPPRESWRPGPKVRPCLVCNKPRLSSSPADRMHAGCRPTGENDGERAALVRPLR
jgi:hypothetical protein